MLIAPYPSLLRYNAFARLGKALTSSEKAFTTFEKASTVSKKALTVL